MSRTYSCPSCQDLMVPARLTLRVKGHGLMDACAQGFVEVNGQPVLHARKGGIFFTRRKAPADRPAWVCTACSIAVVELDSA